MIKAIQDYLTELYPDITFGQIQDSPDGLINVNISNTGKKPFFDESAKLYNISLYVRESSFEGMQNKNGEVSDSLLNTYDKITSNCHIVNTKLMGSQNPERDVKNRYYQLTTFEMLVEEI